MGTRASSSGLTLSRTDTAIVTGMLLRGDRQHDIAAWFGVNGGRIAEISTGARFGWVKAARVEALPPPGPYLCSREVTAALEAVKTAKQAVAAAEEIVRAYGKRAA